MCSLGNKADLTSSSGCRMKRQGLTRDMYGKKTETELQRACGLGPGDEEKQIRGRNRLEAPEVQPETLTRPPRAGAKWRVRRAEPDAEVLLLVCSVTQSRLTLCDPVDCSLPGSSVHGILQARILEWVAISSSRGSS